MFLGNTQCLVLKREVQLPPHMAITCRDAALTSASGVCLFMHTSFLLNITCRMLPVLRAFINRFHEVLMKWSINMFSRKEIDFVQRMFIKAVQTHLLETPLH